MSAIPVLLQRGGRWRKGNCTGHSLLNLEYTVWQEPEKSGFFFFFFFEVLLQKQDAGREWLPNTTLWSAQVCLGRCSLAVCVHTHKCTDT